MKKIYESKAVVLSQDLHIIPNIYDLEKLGTGHDGFVFRYGDKALKLLKYDVEHRKAKGLMTFEKTVFFKNELDMKRIVNPIDIMLDIDGAFSGYVMECLEDITVEKNKESSMQVGDFSCESLMASFYDLQDDFNQLTKKKVLAKDINKGSYLYCQDFMHICDVDKFEHNSSCSAIDDLNKKSLNFVIAKCLYYEMLKLDELDKEQLKKLSRWVKKCSNSRTFLNELEREINYSSKSPISEYVKYVYQKIL